MRLTIGTHIDSLVFVFLVKNTGTQWYGQEYKQEFSRGYPYYTDEGKEHLDPVVP